MNVSGKEVRTLTREAGLIVLYQIDHLHRQGAVLECARAFDVVNSNTFDVTVHAVFLRAAGAAAAALPPYRYVLARRLVAGQRVTLLDDTMFRECAGQEQQPGAVRPFERRLVRPRDDAGVPPRVHLRVNVNGRNVDVELPILQLGSDALGRLFHMGTLA